MKTIFLFIFFCLCIIQFANAELVTGKIIDAETEEPVAFVHIVVDEKYHYFSDSEGEFHIDLPRPDAMLFFRKYLYKDTIFYNQHSFKFLLVQMSEEGPFDYALSTSDQAKAVHDQVLAYAEVNNPEAKGGFQYQTYNKLTVSTGDVKGMKKKLNKMLSRFKFVHGKLAADSLEHHMIMMESVTQKKFLNKQNQSEVIIASNTTGIEKPTFFTVNSQFQPFTLYEHVVKLMGEAYTGPLTHLSSSWYHYELLETVVRESDTVFILKFNPHHKRRMAFLKGILYVSSLNYGVVYAEIYPCQDQKSSETCFYLSSQYLPNKGWFPERHKTSLLTNKRNKKGMNKMDIIDRTFIYNVATEQVFSKKQFSEVVLDYRIAEEINSEDFWKEARKQALTGIDSNTYIFYDSLGTIRQFERFINVGEGILYGEIPVKDIVVDISKLVNLNRHEGLRLGFGLHTNNKISTKFNVGGYLGFGFLDNKFKYGLDANYFFTDDKTHKIRAFYQHDLREAAARFFMFDKHQHSTESVRKFNLEIFDMVSSTGVEAEARLFWYLQMRFSVHHATFRPLYTYTFSPDSGNVFRFGEIQIGAQFAYGEQFMRLLHKRFSFGTHYPVVWAMYTRGMKDFLGGEFDFHKFDLKIEKKIRIAGLGTSSFQFTMGKIWGDLPYSRLYDGRGSYRAFSAVAHNSFETMYMNEFLSSQYMTLFYSHRFEKIKFRNFKKQPIFQFIHNMGIGSLRNAHLHSFLYPKETGAQPFKTMEKGYFETGIYATNLVLVKITALNIGLGAGIFFRYGANANPVPSDNILYKLALNFQL